jgi:hypothetical protein
VRMRCRQWRRNDVVEGLSLTQTQSGLDILRWCSPLAEGEWSFRAVESCDGWTVPAMVPAQAYERW